jgi:hypothetical protein
MANSAIRIPIPGSIINAPGAQEGDLLYFNSTLGQGGSFTNFKPLITDLRPFTKNSVLDFYVSVLSESESTVWENATTKGMTLAAGLDGGGGILANDIRLGVNLAIGRPSHTLEVVGDLMVWGDGTRGGDIIGSIKYYQGNDGSSGGTPAYEHLIFETPRKSHTDAELNAVQSSLREGRILAKHPTTKQTYFARIEDILSPGEGIAISGNTVSLNQNISNITSDNGVTIKLDNNQNGGETEALSVVESVSLPNGQPTDFPLVKVVRCHTPNVQWSGSAYVLGSTSSQEWPTVKMTVGTGTRLVPAGLVIEDGAPVTADGGESDQDGYASGLGGSFYARLFGAVASNPADIIITGSAPDPLQAYYYDVGLGADSRESTSSGRFGFLPGVPEFFGSGGYSNPGSFVAGFLNKHIDGGGVKVKVGDENGDEFALFMENSDIVYDTGATGGDVVTAPLNARHYTIAEDHVGGTVNDQYRNVLAEHAPIFTVRATTGDTFIRGLLTMPFLPGINSDVDGVDTSPVGSSVGANEGEVIYTTHTSSAGVVSIRKYEWCFTCGPAGAATWTLKAIYTLPKGTLYCDASGNLKIARAGNSITNHGLNGVTSWLLSD